jgi:Peroxidase, family 2
MDICACGCNSHPPFTNRNSRSPRNGKNLSMTNFAHALQEGYHLSIFLAWFLAIGSFLLLRQFGQVSLGDLARHNCIEHDASLAHKDAEFQAEYAPCAVDNTLLAAFISDAKTLGEGEFRMNSHDVARARVRRERESPVLDPVHAEIARGEMAIALGIFGGKNGSKDGVRTGWLKEWFVYERLPQDWRYTHTQDIIKTLMTSRDIRNAMKQLRKEHEKEDAVRRAWASSEALLASGELAHEPAS